jgi:hypothetical protein
MIGVSGTRPSVYQERFIGVSGTGRFPNHLKSKDNSTVFLPLTL